MPSRKLVLLLAVPLVRSATSAPYRTVDEHVGPTLPTSPPQANASLSVAFADSFSSEMVLQQLPSPTVIWGFARDGVRVTVERATGSSGTAAAIVATTTGSDGVWRITMPGRPAGNESFTFSATASQTTIMLNNVVYGDVWLCSGQSNMAFALAQAFNAADEIASANRNVRLFAANSSCGHGKSCHFNKSNDHVSPCTRPPCFTTGPNAHWSVATPDVLSSDGEGHAKPVWTGSFSAVCYLFGKKIQEARGYPIGLISSFIGGTPDECWSSREALAQCREGGRSTAAMDHGDCWYSMITPLLRTPIKGVVWYQGESDTKSAGAPKQNPTRALIYNCTFPAMVRDWRAKFSAASFNATPPNFPFGIVQLAPWGVGHGEDDNDGCGDSSDCEVAQVRWAQTLAGVGDSTSPPLLSNAFMAVTTDLGDFSSPYGSVHPRHKITVGDRLALGARAIAYGEQRVYWTGPIKPIATAGVNGLVHVQFQSCDAHGIELRETVGFELQIGGRHWVPALALKNSWVQQECSVDIVVRLPEGNGGDGAGAPATMVRYNWYRSVCFANQTSGGSGAGRCAVYAGGLPAPPFIARVSGARALEILL